MDIQFVLAYLVKLFIQIIANIVVYTPTLVVSAFVILKLYKKLYK